MKHHFDFLIEEEKDSFKTVLRFYPKQSHVHGFNEDSPSTWKEVYKTYMTFSILRYDKWDETEPYETPCELFGYISDEGEGLRLLKVVLEEILSNNSKDEYEVIPFGYGVDWYISKNKIHNDEYIFLTVDNLTGQAFRFCLKENKILEFYNILDVFLEYMLKHSEGI